jgi:hypothetical protein
MKRPQRKSIRTLLLKSKSTPKRDRPGRPEHVPTDWYREQVETFASVGYAEDEIAGYLKISRETLRKYYKRQLAYATMDMLGLAKKGLAEALRHKKTWAIIFVLKTRGRKMHNGEGWLERTELTGAGGKPLIPEVDITKLSDAELIKLREAQRLLASIAPTLTSGAGDSEESD